MTNHFTLRGDAGRVRVGIVGTGFVARHFFAELVRRPEWQLGRVLTRRPLGSVAGFPEAALTDSADALIEAADLVFECTGDVAHATQVIGQALAAGRPVATLNLSAPPRRHSTTWHAFCY